MAGCTLFKSPDAWTLHGGTRCTVRIGRVSPEISVIPSEKIPRVGGIAIEGIIGLIQLRQARQLIVATKLENHGSFFGHKVFRVTGTDLLPSIPLQGDDVELTRLLEAHLDSSTLWWSPTLDLSNSLQRHYENAPPDDRFVWNWSLIQDFPTEVRKDWILPLVFGVFSVTEINLHGESAQFGLITRRSRYRAGTRYFRRGVDAEGHVANFNETEQILGINGRQYSYVQTRGSVPAFWGEVNQLKYKPTLRIGEEIGVDAAARHFAEQKRIYGKQYLVNLVNQSGYEKPVKDVYESLVSALHDSQIQYVYFDFHHECSKMRWDRVQILLDELDKLGLSETGWFAVDAGDHILRRQTGVVRTNCMDCLDRTNVVQSSLALLVLQRQLKDAGFAADISHDTTFLSHFRAVWADNADGVSTAYSGTGALKTDFTRTGKRTRMGAFQDLRNSIARYYLNNFRDGPRQDAYSLFVGEFDPVSSDQRPLFRDRIPLGVQSVPYVCTGSAIITLVSIFSPNPRFSWLLAVAVTLLFGSLTVLSFLYIRSHGIQYVNWPRLLPVDFVRWSPPGYSMLGRSSKKD